MERNIEEEMKEPLWNPLYERDAQRLANKLFHDGKGKTISSYDEKQLRERLLILSRIYISRTMVAKEELTTELLKEGIYSVIE